MDRDGVMRLLDCALGEAKIKAKRGEDHPWEKMSQTVSMALREAGNWDVEKNTQVPASLSCRTHS